MVSVKMESAETIKERWREEEKHQFCKQSCTKIDQGLNKLDNWSARRAIWELFQNARDLATTNASGQKEAHIKITLTPSEFIFAHQGWPFNHDSFSSLIKQVSAQAKENEDSVGQYGTGFLTTHAFGRRIYISGSLDLQLSQENKYVNIDNFEIDRTYDNITNFVEKMAHQLLSVEDLADKDHIDTCREWTELHYQLASAKNAYSKAKQGIEAAIKVMPYVMTVNDSIKEVEIVDETEEESHCISFSKSELPDENDLKVMGVSVTNNGSESLKKVFYLKSDDSQDIVILPLKDAHTAESLNGIAKLFVHFPLLGTEDFGMDFIFHSHRFLPVEERNAIYLPQGENENVRSKYEENVKVMEEMRAMLFNYIETHVGGIYNWVDITTLKFECNRSGQEVTNQYFRSEKQKWVGLFENLPIVPIGESLVDVKSSGVKVFSKQLVNWLEGNHAGHFCNVYKTLVNTAIPIKDEMLKWSKVLHSWYSSDSACFLSLDKLASHVSQTNLGKEYLLKFDEFVKDVEEDRIFEQYALVPNSEGELKKKSDLLNAKGIHPDVCKWSSALIKGVTDRFADNTFTDITNLAPYSATELRRDLNDALARLRRNYIDQQECYEDSICVALAHLSGIIAKEKECDRNNVLPVIWKQMNIQEDCWLATDNDADIAELPFKHLVENQLLHISLQDATWIEANYEYVLSLHAMLNGWCREYYNPKDKSGYAMKYGAFPNCKNEPCLARELKSNEGIPDELASLYNQVCDKDLAACLVKDDFASCVDFDKLTPKEIGADIERVLAETDYKSNHVLEIIDKLDSGKWSNEWFPNVFKNKADLFFKQAVSGEKKDSIYSIMKIDDPDKLKELADLAACDDIQAIIAEGRKAIEAREQEKRDFEFKHSLGKYVEEAITGYLESSLNVAKDDLTFLDAQDGQDIVVQYKGHDIYLIEVKSRWSTDQSVMMSPLQMNTARDNAAHYALCCVDMSDYRQSADMLFPNDIVGRTKVVMNIGELLGNLQVGEDAGVHISNYKCVVPQTVINANAQTLADMIKQIVLRINS